MKRQSVEAGAGSSRKPKLPMFVDKDMNDCAETMLVMENEILLPIKCNTKSQREAQRDEIIVKTCALLNSGGGVLRIKNVENKQINKLPIFFDRWLKSIDEAIKKLIDPQNMSDFVSVEGDCSSEYVNFFVTAAKEWKSINLDCYSASNCEVTKMSISQVKTLLSERKKKCSIKCHLEDLPKLPHQLTKEEYMPANLSREDTQVQFKNINISKDTILSDNLGKYISGFANTRGGHIFFGVDDECITKGIDLKNINSIKLKQKVKRELEKIQWGFVPQENTHWKITFIPVTSESSVDNDEENEKMGNCHDDGNIVIVISVAGIKYSGGVYRRIPESYYLDEETKVVKMEDFEEWAAKTNTVGGDSSLDYRTKRMEKLETSSDISRPIYYLEDDQTIENARKELFSGESVTGGVLHSLSSTYKKNIEDNILEVVQGTSICVKSFYCECIKDAHAMKLLVPNTLVCDILLFVVGKGIFLLTLSRGASEEICKYSRETAKELKSALVKIGGCTKQFAINHNVVDIDLLNAPVELVINNFYPKEYHNIDQDKVKSITYSLTAVLLSFSSTHLSSKVGCTYLNALTVNQFHIFWKKLHDFSSKHLWIKGPPGTGKTLMALEFMKKKHKEENLSPEQILYVNEYKGALQLALKTGVCIAITRAAFVRGDFPEVKHIVMDGVQFYRHEDRYDKWYCKARSMTNKSGGYFWCFIDLAQKIRIDYPYNMSGIPGLLEPCYSLRKVVRNSINIFNHAKQYLCEVLYSEGIEVAHSFDGCSPCEIEHCESLQHLGSILDTLKSEGYLPQDIAVLVNTKKDISKVKYEIEALGYNVKDEESTQSDCIVLTSIRSYSDLERPVIIGIHPMADGLTNHLDALMLILCTRALCKLFILWERQSYPGHPSLFACMEIV
ncbi:schlafen family member 9-like [Saccoglossus kowalevskii]|uniref:Schlafen family member 13-like n=1 Tax=Saccoglossus kowalevskii TaxID=10224 RepID=A0ABM0H0U2_SACKO|nr:PREDICTED: schlafen family member 13-like [Saccoglossus kowalevskii]